MSWREVTAEELSFSCDPFKLKFETTEEVAPLEGIIGQERAVRAMEFGLRIKRHGYNIFMTGLTGTGKASYARSIVKKIAAGESVPDDWCYVYNFENPGRPVALNLPAGMGSAFCRDIEELLEDIKQNIPKAFDGEDYERQKAVYVKEFQEARSALLEELGKAAQDQGFVLKRTSSGFVTVPIINGEQINEEEYARLDQPMKEELEKKSTDLQLKAMEIMRRIQHAEKALKDQLKQLDERIALMAIGYLFDALKEKYAAYPKVQKYLQAFQNDVLESLHTFRGDDDEQQLPLLWFRQQSQEQAELRYKVNLLVDNRETEGAPMVLEPNPSYYNLLGRVEYENRMGNVITDFTMIKSGAFHRANGGYLILQARDVMTGLQAWEVLKRVLKTREITIENLGEHYGLNAMATLKPEPVPLDIKVVMIGAPLIYHILYHNDEDFRKLFKVKADFDTEMDRHERNIEKMAGFIATHCQEHNLKHFDRFAVARVVEYSARLAEHQEKLSTCFNDIVELIYEADTWARIDGVALVGAAQVQKAMEEKIYRSNRYEEKIKESIEKGQLLIDVESEKIGQINGLSVVDLGDYRFGRPSRITATTYPGRKGIINIERESQLSGRIHDKGVLILGGYLGMRYGQQENINLSAGLCFEQSYQGVEGDSASAAELFCLLSSLAEVPLKQGLAVTGSVNQHGEIQPVGGINEKIEGFFAACKVKGLTGSQGVIIPEQNLQNLMLKEEVRKAVREGRFHIYAIPIVDDGLELLTGMEPGSLQEDGSFPSGTFNALVVEKLKKYNELLTAKNDAPAGEQSGEEPSRGCRHCD